MQSENQKAIDTLVAFGFDPNIAYVTVEYGEIKAPLNENVCKNAELLCRLTGAERSKEKGDICVVIFLNRRHEDNLFMAAVPEKYGFTEEETRAYLANPLDWDMPFDLKTELDEALAPLMPCPEKRMKVYREMYQNGAWAHPETLRKICGEVHRLARGQEGLEKLMEEWWFVLFSMYSGPLEYIEVLKKHFVPEVVWTIFSENPAYSKVFDDNFSISIGGDTVMERLREKYSRWIIPKE